MGYKSSKKNKSIQFQKKDEGRGICASVTKLYKTQNDNT